MMKQKPSDPPKAQSTIQYTIVIALVGISVLLMGPYLFRAINAHLKAQEDAIYDAATDPLKKDDFLPAMAMCGNGVCDQAQGEDSNNCCVDCGRCGDMICCDSSQPVPGGETVTSCPEDCGFCGDGQCCDSGATQLCEEHDETDPNTTLSIPCCEDCGSCGDGICCTDAGAQPAGTGWTGNPVGSDENCLQDCPRDLGCNKNGICDLLNGENCSNCCYECPGLGSCTNNNPPGYCPGDGICCGDAGETFEIDLGDQCNVASSELNSDCRMKLDCCEAECTDGQGHWYCSGGRGDVCRRYCSPWIRCEEEYCDRYTPGGGHINADETLPQRESNPSPEDCCAHTNCYAIVEFDGEYSANSWQCEGKYVQCMSRGNECSYQSELPPQSCYPPKYECPDYNVGLNANWPDGLACVCYNSKEPNCDPSVFTYGCYICDAVYDPYSCCLGHGTYSDVRSGECRICGSPGYSSCEEVKIGSVCLREQECYSGTPCAAD